MKTNSIVVSPFPSIFALRKGIERIGGKEWKAINAAQERWVELYGRVSGLGDRFTADELVSIAADTAAEINEFMARNGFPEIVLDPWAAMPPSVGVGSVLKVPVKWLQPGVKTAVLSGKFPAFELKPGVAVRRAVDGTIVVEMATQSEDTVCVAIQEEALAGFDLYDRAVRLDGMEKSRTDFDRVIVPMVNFDEFADTSWIIGLNTEDATDTPWDVVQAKEKSRFMMNEIGARLETGFAGQVMMRSMPAPPKPYIVDRPFLLWLTRPGIPVPIAACRFEYDVWSEPAEV